MNATEIWRPTHNPSYEVSNLGRVRSWTKPGGKNGRTRATEPKVLRGSPTPFGYRMVVMYPEVRGYLVHGLVAAAFLGPRPPGCHVMHLDDDPTNNAASNLRYGTPRENMRQCLSRDRQKRRRLTNTQVRDIRAYLETQRTTSPARRLHAGTAARVAAEYGVSERCIEALWTGPNYAHV